MRESIGALLLLLLAAPASARSVVVIVGDAPDPASMRAAVIEAVAERGIRLVRTPDGDVCGEDLRECARDLAARAGADATLWIEAELGETNRVRALLVPAVGAAIERTVEAGTDLDVSAVAAAVAVLSEVSEEVGFILVRSDPPGAEVRIDGTVIGHAPVRHAFPPGDHRVRVEGDGERSVTVHAGEETSVEPTPGGAPPPPGVPPAAPGPRRSEPSPFNWVIGGGLAIGGVVALISPLSSLAREGECVEAIAEVGCVEQVRFGPQSGVLLGVGLAALVGAVIVDGLAPIRVDVAVSGRGARARIGGRF